MKKLLLLLILPFGLIGNSYAATIVITCDTESVIVDNTLGKRTKFPGSTDNITMILEYINKEPVDEITSITTKQIIGGEWNDGKKFNTTTKFKILKQSDKALTAISDDVNVYGAEILFLNKQNGEYTSAYVNSNEANGTIGKCYK